MRRFFYDSSEIIDGNVATPLAHYQLGDAIALPDNVRHHWCRVLRANIGDQAWLFDGHGGEYQVELIEVSKKQATVKLLAMRPEDRSAALTTCIGLVMSRGERMDYAIQKSTELGVTAIQLLTSQHGEVQLKGPQVDKKLNHWQQVAIAACEQCSLNRPPLIIAPMPLSSWLTQTTEHAQNKHSMTDHPFTANPTHSLLDSQSVTSTMQPLLTEDYYQSLLQPADINLILSVPEDSSQLLPSELLNILTQSQVYINVLIGPEGGLSIEEQKLAQELGFQAWQIGPRVLRTETAPVVALASLNALHSQLSTSQLS